MMSKNILTLSLLHPISDFWKGKRFNLAVLFIYVAITTMAQTNELTPVREKQKWAIGGLITFLAPDIEPYDKNLECYNPPAPMVWFGPSLLNEGLLGNCQAEFHLRNGLFNKCECGFTVLQISRNLYHGVIGISTSLQFGGLSFGISRDFSVERDGRYVDFLPSNDYHKNHDLSFTYVRIPLLIGAQTNNRLFSLQTGLGLCYTYRPGLQWLSTAGIGPLTINLSQNLTHLFKLRDGSKAYPLSISIGLDVWYLLSHWKSGNHGS